MQRILLSFKLVAIFASVFSICLSVTGCGGSSGAPPPPPPAPASIVSQPASTTVAAGQSVTFSVTATGPGPISYQWRRNAVNIPGATSSSYTYRTLLSGEDNGWRFDVVISSPGGSVTSHAAVLTVNFPPVITAQPASQFVTEGHTAIFSVTAKGTAPLSYQWRKNGMNIPGATTANFETAPESLSDDNVMFDVVVSNAFGTVTSNHATLTVSPAVGPSVRTQPANQTVTAGQTATFSVTADGSLPLAYQWQKNGVNIAGATSSSYTTPTTQLGDSGTQFEVVVSNSAGRVTSEAATLTVTPVNTAAVDVITYHYDNLRTGQNLKETTLTPANVNSAQFGKKGELVVDGKVDAQPLYLSSVTIPGFGTKNVLYVVTEHDSVYAFDADNVNGTSSSPLWQVSALSNGEMPSDNRGCDQVAPGIGITSTPVIDRNRGPHGAIYVVAMSKDSNGNYFQRLHALDLTNGKELFGGPATIQASFPGFGPNSTAGRVTFDAKQYKERAALLQVGGTIYTTWASHCDIQPYNSWVMAFSADSLAQTGVLNLTPNGAEGGIWMSGGGPAADAAGNVYFMVGNGTFDTALNPSGFPGQGDCGNCFVKLSGNLTLNDYFTPAKTVSESASDIDFGSGGPLLLPDIQAGGQARHLAVGAGKDSVIYVLDRDNMGKFNMGGDNIYQRIDGQLTGQVFSKPSFFSNTVYYGAVGDALKAFPIAAGKLAVSAAQQSAHHFSFPGTTPSISANGASAGILWAVENNGAILFAYDASDLTKELYNSNQATGNRDHFSGNKFITPVVANGKVYVGTQNSVAVFGLLP